MAIDITSFPAKGAANFEVLARQGLTELETYLEALWAEVEAARKGLASLLAEINILADASGITDGSITEAKLDILDIPSNGEALSWNAGSGKFEWVPFGSAEDTKQVKMDAADSEGYLGAKVDDTTIKANGSKLLYVVDGSTTVKGVVSVNPLDFTAASGAVSLKQATYLAKTSDYAVSPDDLRGNTIITNSGASGEVILSLPAGAAGYQFEVEVVASQYLRLKANGSETLIFDGSETAAGGYFRTNTPSRRLKGKWNGAKWAVTEAVGYWRKDS